MLDGLLTGIAISLVMLLRGLSTPRVSELGRRADGHDFLSCKAHPDVHRVEGLLVLRPEAALFFANVEHVTADLRARIAAAGPRGVVLSLEETPDLDGTSIEALTDFCAERARAGVALMLARLKDPVLALLEVSRQSVSNAMVEPGSVDDAVSRLLGNAPAGLTPNSRIKASEPENVDSPLKG